MAAVSIPPSPQLASTMTTRRAPLANVPNATNSPYRPTSNPSAKRPRSHATDLRELAYAQPPPAKRQLLEENGSENRRNSLFRKAGQNPQTPLTRKFEAVRESRPAQKPAEKAQKPAHDNLEVIRQWQKHYRKAFPSFVFYFEGVSDAIRIKAIRQLLALGAREEKFFSKAVTHVVTMRQIPPEGSSASTSSDLKAIAAQAATSPQSTRQTHTINPSVLDRTADLQRNLAAQRRQGVANTQQIIQDVETRGQASNNGDILFKAREMGMKIWALEKLHRVLDTMFNTETGEQSHLHNTRGNASALAQTKVHREADLSQLLRNEKVNGPADRDLAVATKDMAQFRGYYVYVHCMNEKYRPVVVRDYPKTEKKDEGKWPQFKISGQGRCPFVEDPSHVRSLQQPRNQRAASTAPRTRAAAALEAKQAPYPKPAERQPLLENTNMATRIPNANEQSTDQLLSKPLEPPRTIPAKRGHPDGVAPLTRTNTTDSMPPLFGSAQASLRQMPRFAGGEPVASGVQPSNITSAIRSQMISSTAAAPGVRAGTSKELHQLSRKVLEKNSAPNSTTSSYLTQTDVRAAINGERGLAPRAAKRKAQQTLTHVREDFAEDDNERKGAPIRRKKPVEKDPKPGYCENCREKFDDFDHHIASRKHRKFAVTRENWEELDSLLSQLDRPVLSSPGRPVL